MNKNFLAAALVSLLLHAGAAAADELLQLAIGADRFTPLDGGRVLCLQGSRFTAVDALTGAAQSWDFGWDPVADGWTDFPEDESQIVQALTSSADGSMVAIGAYVGIKSTQPGDDYPYFVTAVVLTNSQGEDARCVALGEPTDGGLQLEFSRDGSRLFVQWPVPCAPTPAAYLQGYEEGFDGPSRIDFNYVGLPDGALEPLPGLPDVDFLFERNPLNDTLAGEMFAESWELVFSDLQGSRLARFAPGGEFLGGFISWCGADTLLLNSGGAQTVVRTDGSWVAHPDASWHCFTPLPNGRALFSRDGGRTVEIGSPDFVSRTVADARSVGALERFREVGTGSDWPEILHRWMLMPGGRQLLVWDPIDMTVYALQQDISAYR